MARRRLVRIGQVVGGLGLRIAAVAVTLGARDGRPGPGSQPAEPASRTAVSNRPCAADIRSLAEWHKQLTPPQAREAQPPKPLTEAETMEWIDAAAAVRAGYPGLPAQGKLLTVEVMARILDRFSVEGTPAGWTRVLPLSFDVLAAGLADAQVLIRKTALDEVGRLWVWAPGCTMTPAEEQAVARLKEGALPDGRPPAGRP